ncbi:MAG: hypothetical protein ACI9CF_000880 [Candidatus Omnitrophota bacterium]|jgi:hypothetical protein
MLNNKKLILKFLSTCIVLCLLIEQVVYAAPNPVILPQIGIQLTSQKALGFKIPSHIATIEDHYLAPESNKKILLIQDAHTNMAAQLNIAKTLDLIIAKKSIRHIFLEAGNGDLSLSSLREVASEKNRQEVGLKYMRQGILQGSEYLDLTSEYDIKLWGVEDRSLYDKGLRAYADVVESRDETQVYLSRVESTLNTLESAIYNPYLLALGRMKKAYASSELSFMEYAKHLNILAKRQNIATNQFKHLQRVIQLQKDESNIDFEKANQEFEDFRLLRSARNDVDAIAGQSHEKKIVIASGSAAISEQSTHTYGSIPAQYDPINNLDVLNTLDLRVDSKLYPNLSRYQAYLAKTKKLNAKQSLQELKSLEQRLLKQFATTQDQRDLLTISGKVQELNSLIDLQLQPEGHAGMRDGKGSYNLQFITGFMNQKILELKKYQSHIVELDSGVNQVINKAKLFYDVTQDRDKAILENALHKMNIDDVDQSVLIVGGFHIPNLTKRLEERGISYAVITPTITQETNHARYEKLLLGQDFNSVDQRDLSNANMSALLQVRSPGSRLSIGRLRNELISTNRAINLVDDDGQPDRIRRASRMGLIGRVLQTNFSNKRNRLLLYLIPLTILWTVFVLSSFEGVQKWAQSAIPIMGSVWHVWWLATRLFESYKIESLLDNDQFPLLSKLTESELSQLKEWLKKSQATASDASKLLEYANDFSIMVGFDYFEKTMEELMAINISNQTLYRALINRFHEFVSSGLSETPESIQINPIKFNKPLQLFNEKLNQLVQAHDSAPRMTKAEKELHQMPFEGDGELRLHAIQRLEAWSGQRNNESDVLQSSRMGGMVSSEQLTKWLAGQIWRAAGRPENTADGEALDWFNAQTLLGYGWQIFFHETEAVEAIADSISLARNSGEIPIFNDGLYEADGESARQITKRVIAFLDQQIQNQIDQSRQIADKANVITLVNSLDLERLEQSKALLTTYGIEYQHFQEGGTLHGGDWFRAGVDGEWGLIEIADGVGNGVKATPSWILQKIINDYEIDTGQPVIKSLSESTSDIDRIRILDRYVTELNDKVIAYDLTEVDKNDASTFTYAFALINFATGDVYEFSAGHPRFIGQELSGQWSGQSFTDGRASFPLGLVPDVDFDLVLNKSIEALPSMSVLTLVSDGVTDYFAKVLKSTSDNLVGEKFNELLNRFFPTEFTSQITNHWGELLDFLTKISNRIQKIQPTDLTWIAVDLKRAQEYHAQLQEKEQMPEGVGSKTKNQRTPESPRMTQAKDKALAIQAIEGELFTMAVSFGMELPPLENLYDLPMWEELQRRGVLSSQGATNIDGGTFITDFAIDTPELLSDARDEIRHIRRLSLLMVLLNDYSDELGQWAANFMEQIDQEILPQMTIAEYAAASTLPTAQHWLALPTHYPTKLLDTISYKLRLTVFRELADINQKAVRFALFGYHLRTGYGDTADKPDIEEMYLLAPDILKEIKHLNLLGDIDSQKKALTLSALFLNGLTIDLLDYSGDSVSAESIEWLDDFLAMLIKDDAEAIETLLSVFNILEKADYLEDPAYLATYDKSYEFSIDLIERLNKYNAKQLLLKDRVSIDDFLTKSEVARKVEQFFDAEDEELGIQKNTRRDKYFKIPNLIRAKLLEKQADIAQATAIAASHKPAGYADVDRMLEVLRAALFDQGIAVGDGPIILLLTEMMRYDSAAVAQMMREGSILGLAAMSKRKSKDILRDYQNNLFADANTRRDGGVAAGYRAPLNLIRRISAFARDVPAGDRRVIVELPLGLKTHLEIKDPNSVMSALSTLLMFNKAIDSNFTPEWLSQYFKRRLPEVERHMSVTLDIPLDIIQFQNIILVYGSDIGTLAYEAKDGGGLAFKMNPDEVMLTGYEQAIYEELIHHLFSRGVSARYPSPNSGWKKDFYIIQGMPDHQFIGLREFNEEESQFLMDLTNRYRYRIDYGFEENVIDKLFSTHFNNAFRKTYGRRGTRQELISLVRDAIEGAEAKDMGVLTNAINWLAYEHRMGEYFENQDYMAAVERELKFLEKAAMSRSDLTFEVRNLFNDFKRAQQLVFDHTYLKPKADRPRMATDVMEDDVDIQESDPIDVAQKIHLSLREGKIISWESAVEALETLANTVLPMDVMPVFDEFFTEAKTNPRAGDEAGARSGLYLWVVVYPVLKNYLEPNAESRGLEIKALFELETAILKEKLLKKSSLQDTEVLKIIIRGVMALSRDESLKIYPGSVKKSTGLQRELKNAYRAVITRKTTHWKTWPEAISRAGFDPDEFQSAKGRRISLARQKRMDLPIKVSTNPVMENGLVIGYTSEPVEYTSINQSTVDQLIKVRAESIVFENVFLREAKPDNGEFTFAGEIYATAKPSRGATRLVTVVADGRTGRPQAVYASSGNPIYAVGRQKIIYLTSPESHVADVKEIAAGKKPPIYKAVFTLTREFFDDPVIKNAGVALVANQSLHTDGGDEFKQSNRFGMYGLRFPVNLLAAESQGHKVIVAIDTHTRMPQKAYYGTTGKEVYPHPKHYQVYIGDELERGRAPDKTPLFRSIGRGIQTLFPNWKELEGVKSILVENLYRLIHKYDETAPRQQSVEFRTRKYLIKRVKRQKANVPISGVFKKITIPTRHLKPIEIWSAQELRTQGTNIIVYPQQGQTHVRLNTNAKTPVKERILYQAGGLFDDEFWSRDEIRAAKSIEFDAITVREEGGNKFISYRGSDVRLEYPIETENVFNSVRVFGSANSTAPTQVIDMRSGDQVYPEYIANQKKHAATAKANSEIVFKTPRQRLLSIEAIDDQVAYIESKSSSTQFFNDIGLSIDDLETLLINYYKFFFDDEPIAMEALLSLAEVIKLHSDGYKPTYWELLYSTIDTAIGADISQIEGVFISQKRAVGVTMARGSYTKHSKTDPEPTNAETARMSWLYRLIDFSTEQMLVDYREELAIFAYGLYKANRYDLSEEIALGRSLVAPKISYDALGNEVLNLGRFSIGLDEAADIVASERLNQSQLRQKYIEGNAVMSVLSNRQAARDYQDFVRRYGHMSQKLNKGIVIQSTIFDRDIDIYALDQHIELLILNLVQLHKVTPEVAIYLDSGFARHKDMILELLERHRVPNLINWEEPREGLVMSLGSMGKQNKGWLHTDISPIQANDIPQDFNQAIYQGLKGLHVFGSENGEGIDFENYSAGEVSRLREDYNAHALESINDNQTFIQILSGDASMRLRQKHAWTIAQAIPIEYALRAMQRTIQAVSTSQ